MSATFKESWKSLHAAGKTQEVQCLPLRDILAEYNIRHIDFFSLDVEGGELMVLQSIDWSKVTVNVILVELDGTNQTKDEDVRQLLKHAGYKWHSRDRNNEWFVRDGFVYKH